MTDTAKCSKCKAVKPVSDFYRNRSRASGRHHECRDCSSARSRERPYNPEKARHYTRVSSYRSKYGLELEDVEKLFASQGGLCAICNTRPSVLHIDHDHETGEIRGALCLNCNLGIGHFSDDIGLLSRAVEYLDR